MTVANPRILLVGDSLALGGTEGQFTEIAVGLSRSRWDVDVSCLRAEGPLRTKLESAGVRAWSCGRGSLKSPRLLLAVSALTRYLRTHRVQLVHAFDFYSNILGVLAARIARVPVVIASQRDLGDLRPPFQRRVHQSVLRFADYILVNSEAVAERIEPLSEACSNVLLEAMATGLAVVATRVGWNPELVEDEVTGLLTPPADPAGLAKAIMRLIEQPAVVERLGACARERARMEFSIERMLDRIQLCYQQALGASAW